MKWIPLFIGVLFLAASACVKSFEYETTNYERVLVVDGSLSDVSGKHYVNLSYTQPINSSQQEKITDATVYVQLGSGERISYVHEGRGVYATEDDISASVGETYQLFIVLADNTEVTSDVIQLIPSPPIDSIYARTAELPSEILNRNETGVQFFLDSQDPTREAKYFRYEWDATYVVQVPYDSYFEYDPVLNEILARKDNVGRCYLNDTSQQLIIGTSTTNIENRSAQVPINFIGMHDDHRLRSRYSIKVRQYAIDEGAFLFYKKIKETNESAGSLFDTQQGSVIGNMRFTANEKLPVLGYFEVAGVSELRQYFTSRDVPDFGVPAFLFVCDSEDLVPLSTRELIEHLKMTTDLISTVGDFPSQYIIGPRECLSCTWYASNIKPTWWIF